MRQPPHPQAGGGSGNPPAEDGGLHDAQPPASGQGASVCASRQKSPLGAGLYPERSEGFAGT